MPDEQTTPNPDAEATQAPVVEATPAESGSPTTTVTEPNASPDAESYTPEEVAQWRQDAARVHDAQAEITRQQQTNAELRTAQERNERMLEAAIEREQARVNPMDQANQTLHDALYSGDMEAFTRAQGARDQLLEQGIEGRLQQRLYNQINVQRNMEEARKMGGFTEQQLAQTAQSLTPQDLALVELNRQGKAGEFLNQRQKQADDDAQRAASLNSLLGGDGTPSNGFGYRNQKPTKVVSFLELAAANMQSRKELLEPALNDEIALTIEDLPAGLSPEDAARQLLNHKRA